MRGQASLGIDCPKIDSRSAPTIKTTFAKPYAVAFVLHKFPDDRVTTAAADAVRQTGNHVV